MKTMKKIFYFVIALALISAVVNFFNQETLQEGSEVEHLVNKQLTEFDTVQDNSIEITSFDDLYSRADDVRNESFGLRGTEQIDFIMARVSEDIPADLDKQITLDALNYVITEYENRRFNKNAPVNLYITRLLDKQLDQYPELAEADSMVFDMFQICKDILRMTSDNLVETNTAVSINEEQIDKVLESVKSHLN